MAFKAKRKRKKYSLNERIEHHNKKCDVLVQKNLEKGRGSDSVFALFKRRDFAYSQGYVDGVMGSTQFSEIEKHGGNMKAYEAGVTQGSKHSHKLHDIKF